MSSSLDKKEIENFAKDSTRWWDEGGPFAPLHCLNPARLSYIKAQICAHYGRDVNDFNALKGLKVLDVGCGGGLVCEPMARMGATVTGIDADNQAIAVAKAHAQESDLKISYKATTTDQLLKHVILTEPKGRVEGSHPIKEDPSTTRLRRSAQDDDDGYDVVLALEIIEHVSDIQSFVNSCAALVKPGGLIIFSTLNRTAKSFALGIVAAEYILRCVPRGTHNWKKFVKPSELSRAARNAGLSPDNVSGLVYNPLKSEFSISKTDIDVNYFMNALKP